MDLDSRLAQGLEHLDAAGRVGTDHLAPHVCRDGVDGDVHGLQATGDDAVHVLVGDVGERDEVALEKGQAVVVVAQRERGTRLLGKHRHEAEDAGVQAGADAVEEDVGELYAPVLAGLALELTGGGGAVRGVKDLEVTPAAIRLPAPVDDVPRLDAVDRHDPHAGLYAGVPGWASLLHAGHPGAVGLGTGGGVVGALLLGHGARPPASLGWRPARPRSGRPAWRRPP